ncbi:MAG: hypothetical protein Q8K75_07980 [Chlamydiales bacterium]|nr:hypothetical protein [Chlamydiales bacterium]
MEPVRYMSVGKTGTAWDDVRILTKAVTGSISKQQSYQLRHLCAISCIRKILLTVPEAIYRYTRLFLAVMLVTATQCIGHTPSIRRAKHVVNREVINIASSSFEATVLQLGWVHPRSGLALQALSNLAWRFFHRSNDARRLVGWWSVENHRRPAINLGALRMAFWVRVRRLAHYVKLITASTALAIANKRGDKNLKSRLQHIVDDATYLVKDKINVPRYELAMAFPYMGGSTATFVVHTVQKTMQFASRKFL